MTANLHPTLRRLDDLADSLRADPAVVAVLGLGSAGVEHERFDDHSDIDFFVVVADAATKRRYVGETGWLHGFGGELVYNFLNDPSGRKALFTDGLFLEYAVFTPDELRTIPVHGARKVWSRPGVELLTGSPAAPSPLDTVDRHLNEALTNLFVGLHRELRGERLAALRFIQVYAVDRVLDIERLDPRSRWSQPDPFEPSRRVERLEGRELPLDRMMPGYERNVEAAVEVLRWLTSRQDPPQAIVSAVESLIEGARAAR